MGYWTGRRTLVTGAGGFIGGHLAVALARAGAQVRAFCRYNSRADPGALAWFEQEETAAIEVRFGDLRDPGSVCAALTGMTDVFHLGALIAIPYSLQSPRDVFATNVGGTLNVAQAATKIGIERLIHVSTSEVYGNVDTWPITERHPIAPRSPYAASKAGADNLLSAFHASFGLPVTVVRPFNTYGPHQSARAIVPAIAVQVLAGGTLRLGSLHPRRDLTFVSDTVAGLLALGACDDAVGRTIQLGTGTDVSVAELVALIGELIGRTLLPELDPDRVRPAGGEVARLVSDHSRATELTGWRPTVALRDGVSATLDWIDANRHRYRGDEYTL